MKLPSGCEVKLLVSSGTISIDFLDIPRFYTVTSDVLTAVKKMEDSLKRLKKGRGTEKSGSQGMTDDDKIRQQLILDIGFYGDQVCCGNIEFCCFMSDIVS